MKIDEQLRDIEKSSRELKEIPCLAADNRRICRQLLHFHRVLLGKASVFA